MKKLVSTNPAKNYEVVGSVNVSTLQKIKKKVKEANDAKLAWKELGVKKRIQMLQPIYQEFNNRKKEIAELTSKEIGTPVHNVLEDLNWDEEYFVILPKARRSTPLSRFIVTREACWSKNKK